MINQIENVVLFCLVSFVILLYTVGLEVETAIFHNIGYGFGQMSIIAVGAVVLTVAVPLSTTIYLLVLVFG